MRLRRHFHTEESTGIDLAPMLDFVMNLLIFFIITAVFIKQAGMQVSRPGGGGASGGKDKGAIAIAVDEAGEIYIDGRPIDVRAVRANVERAVAQDPEKGVIVLAQYDAEAGIVVQVVDQIRQAGVMNVAFGTGGER
jgi:biopolymer transport protein ExbD